MKEIHPPIFFNDSQAITKPERKHLSLILDSQLDFQSHIREKTISVRRCTGVMFLIFRDVLDQIYKLYERPHLDYSDTIYNKYMYDPDLELNFIEMLKATKYSAALAFSGAWRRTSRQKLYAELGLS